MIPEIITRIATQSALTIYISNILEIKTLISIKYEIFFKYLTNFVICHGDIEYKTNLAMLLHGGGRHGGDNSNINLNYIYPCKRHAKCGIDSYDMYSIQLYAAS